jgi:hypothetical protein
LRKRVAYGQNAPIYGTSNTCSVNAIGTVRRSLLKSSLISLVCRSGTYIGFAQVGTHLSQRRCVPAVVRFSTESKSRTGSTGALSNERRSGFTQNGKRVKHVSVDRKADQERLPPREPVALLVKEVIAIVDLL